MTYPTIPTYLAMLLYMLSGYVFDQGLGLIIKDEPIVGIVAIVFAVSTFAFTMKSRFVEIDRKWSTKDGF